jgi:hypothetical protein
VKWVNSGSPHSGIHKRAHQNVHVLDWNPLASFLQQHVGLSLESPLPLVPGVQPLCDLVLRPKESTKIQGSDDPTGHSNRGVSNWWCAHAQAHTHIHTHTHTHTPSVHLAAEEQ